MRRVLKILAHVGSNIMEKTVSCIAVASARLTILRIGLIIAAAFVTAMAQIGNAATPSLPNGANDNGGLEPIYHSKLPMPLPRPDIALAYTAIPIEMTPPKPRPSIEDILPTSTATLGQMIAEQTGLESSGENVFELRSGEGVGKLLRRAGYSEKDIASSVMAMQSKGGWMNIWNASPTFSYLARINKQILDKILKLK